MGLLLIYSLEWLSEMDAYLLLRTPHIPPCSHSGVLEQQLKRMPVCYKITSCVDVSGVFNKAALKEEYDLHAKVL